MTYLVETLTGVDVTSISIDRSAPSNHTAQIIVTGSVLPTAMMVDVEGSIDDGASFAVMVSHIFDSTEIASGIALFHVINKGVSHLRVRVVSITGGTDLSIDIWVRDTK